MLVQEHSYSKNIYNQKILIFGPKSPPIGGVSVHIERVSEVYQKNNNLIELFDCTTEITGQNKFSYALKIFKLINKFKPDIIDYHTSFLKYYIPELFILVLLKIFFKFKINIIDHDPRYLYKKTYFQKKILNFLKIFIDQQIIIGSSTYQSYLDNKIKLRKNFSIQSPFLPPGDFQLQDLLKTYPESLFKFINSHKKIILMNAFNIGLLESGQDLYGVDVAIDLVKFLNSDLAFVNQIGLVLLYQTCDEKYLSVIKDKIRNLNLKNNIYFLKGNYILWPLFSKATIFIRPTRSDSWGISIEESLYFGVPAVASDVCQRPKGAILFDVNNEQDFHKKVYNCL